MKKVWSTSLGIFSRSPGLNESTDGGKRACQKSSCHIGSAITALEFLPAWGRRVSRADSGVCSVSRALNVSQLGQDSRGEQFISHGALRKAHPWRMGPAGAEHYQLDHLSSASYYDSFQEEEWLPSGWACLDLLLYFLAIEGENPLHEFLSNAERSFVSSNSVLPQRSFYLQFL